MKLYERFAESGFHTSIVTSFGIDFDTYENVALSRLRGSGCHNNMLVVDGRMLTHALDGGSSLPRHAGRLYSVTGAKAKDVFHPKIFLQVGRTEARLIVSSANMTASGLAGNLELAGIVRSTTADSGERRIIAAAWRYLSSLLDRGDQSVAQQLNWMERRSAWLVAAEPAYGPVELVDGTLAAFLSTGGTAGIAERFSDLIHGTVRRLVVISPYWDNNLKALRALAERLQPERIVVFVDAERALFPAEWMPDIPRLQVLGLKELAKDRFVHAKAIIAQTDDADHVLFGSANCTAAALGLDGFSGSNEEASLYRRLLPNSALEALDLKRQLAEQAPLSADDLPPLLMSASLELEEIGARSPGRFECVYETLTWWPATGIDPTNIVPDLFDDQGTPAGLHLNRMQDSSDSVRFRISGSDVRPAFARIPLGEDRYSALAIVSVVDALRDAARETRGKRAEVAVAQLDSETNEGLWLLEVIDELEAADARRNGGEPIARKATQRPGVSTEGNDAFKVLSYDQFVAGRRLLNDDSTVTRNSLAGSDLSLVRGFLNRILAIGESSSSSEPNDKDLSGAFNLGDEVSDGEAAIEAGDDFQLRPQPQPSDNQEGQDAERRLSVQRRANRDQLVRAVEVFDKRIKERAEGGSLVSFDILRLRAILTVVAASGLDGTDTKDKGKQRTALQVLPTSGDPRSWPRLLGRILFIFFGGRHPSVGGLKVDAFYDQIPHDYLECWATCIWSAHAAYLSAGKEIPGLAQLIDRVYLLTGLTDGELLSERFKEVLQGLSHRFADRLGIDAEGILTAHQQVTKQLRALAA